MDEFNESLKELKNELSVFIKEYYAELIKLWRKLTELETKQKMAGVIYGGLSGVIFSILTFIIINALKK